MDIDARLALNLYCWHELVPEVRYNMIKKLAFLNEIEKSVYNSDFLILDKKKDALINCFLKITLAIQLDNWISLVCILKY